MRPTLSNFTYRVGYIFLQWLHLSVTLSFFFLNLASLRYRFSMDPDEKPTEPKPVKTKGGFQQLGQQSEINAPAIQPESFAGGSLELQQYSSFPYEFDNRSLP